MTHSTSLHIFSLLSAGILIMASACSRNHRQASGVPEIEVAEAVTDSVVLYQTYPGTLNASTVPTWWPVSTARYSVAISNQAAMWRKARLSSR